jgi:hypothetical protein
MDPIRMAGHARTAACGMIRVLLGALIGAILVIRPMGASSADTAQGDCTASSDGYSANSNCAHSASRTLAYVAAHSEHSFEVHQACTTENATCHDTPTCPGGLVYNIWEDHVLLPWQACLTQQQANQINGLTPGFVEHAFKRLTWPASQLVVQPPNGKTLVNFATT